MAKQYAVGPVPHDQIAAKFETEVRQLLVAWREAMLTGEPVAEDNETG